MFKMSTCAEVVVQFILHRNAIVVFGASSHILGYRIYLQDMKIQYNCTLYLTSAIRYFSKMQHLASYASCHYAMAYDTHPHE
jgi:hypothetical protein